MYLDEHIERYEKAIRKFYMADYGLHKGWTELQNIKSKVDYLISPGSDWLTSYFKELQKYAEERKISIPKAKREKICV